MLAVLDKPTCYHSLYQQAGSQSISYFSCYYANTWQKQLSGGKVYGPRLSPACWRRCGRVDQFTSHDRKWRKGMPGLGGSLLSPSYSICPTPNCELMSHTHVWVFHSQWTHAGDGSKDVTSLQSRWQWRLTTACSHKQSLGIFISFLSLPFWVSPKVTWSLDVHEHLFICLFI